jgi:hypothetical protein
MPSTTIQHFDFAHLPEGLQNVSRPIHDLAHQMEDALPDGPEKSAGMRKLLEAKDCFVRAALTAQPVDLRKPVIGQIVHFVMPNGDHRPAIIMQIWGPACVNLQVITDGPNDAGYKETEKEALRNFSLNPDDVKHGHVWATSEMFSADPKPGTWHWIEKA